MYCPKCGASNDANAKFCGSCGTNLLTNNQQTEEVLDINEPEHLDVSEQPREMIEQVSNNNVPVPVMVQPPLLETKEVVSQATQPIINNTNQPVQSPKKSNKPPFIIGTIIAIILLIVSIVGIVSLTSSNETKQEKSKINKIFNPHKLIKVKKDNKFGYIDADGKFVIDAVYETASDFTGDYAVVRAEIKENNLTKSVYQIIDKKGEVKKQAESGIKYIEEQDLWIIDRELYNSSMKKISPENVKVSYEEDGYFIWINQKNKTGGVMNKEGKQTYTYQFQTGENYISINLSSKDETQTERYCIINIENEKYSIVNCDTGVIVQDYTEHYISEQNDNIFKLKNHETWDFVEIMYIQGDKKVYTSTNEDISLYYYPGYVTISDSSKSYSERYTYLHTETLEINDERPSSTSKDDDIELDEWENFTNNKKMSCPTGYGLMKNDQITLPCEWDDLEYLEINLYKYLKDNNKEYIYGKKDNKWYLIDLKTKKEIIEFNASYITQSPLTTFIYYTDQDTKNKKVYNILTGNSINIDSSKTSTIYSNYITVKDKTEKTLKYYNTELKLIYIENL